MSYLTSCRAATFLMAPLFVSILSACQGQEGPESIVLDTPEERLSYGIAIRMGEHMKSDGMNLDVDAYALGLRDVFRNAEFKLTEEEIDTEIQTFQEKAQVERSAKREAIAASNAEAGAAFLTENTKRDGVIVTESGLQYEVIEAGKGDSPSMDDRVEVHYRGTLIDGTEFDSSYLRGKTATFGVTQVIAGWTEALQLMKKGAKYKLFIPSDLAYGAAGTGQVIAPNSTLIFEVELVDILNQDE